MGLVACVALTLATAAFGVESAAAAKQKSKPVTLATLKILAPDVTVKHEGASKFVAAKEGETLGQGDAVQTDESGSAEINYTDGSLTRLAASTEFTITKLTNKQGTGETQGTLTVGETWSRAAKVSENGKFEVKAGGTTARPVEGTAFVFSCVKSTKTNKKGKKKKQKTCQVISVVDTVSVKTPGAYATLPPGTDFVVHPTTSGAATGTLTYDDLIKNQFVVDNLNLDEKAGKGGLYEITPPPPPPPPTTTTTTTTAPAPAPIPITTTPPPPPDATAPSITLSSPAQGTVPTEERGGRASSRAPTNPADQACANCVASTPNGAPIDTSTAGPHTYTVTASDNAGNTSFITHNYTVTA